jgi:hypothetical protein
MAVGVDFEASYVLPADLRVVQRDESTVQIGTERPRRVLLVDAPDHATAVLTGLNATTTAGQVVARFDGDPLVWRSVLGQLLTAGLLVPAPRSRPRSPHLAGERLALIHRYGMSVADRVLTARSDALVVVDGDGPLADAVASLLGSSGIGHVHQHHSAGHDPAPRTDPAASERDAAWRAAPDVRVHRPAPQVPPSAVVLADARPPDLARAAELVTGLIPHLPVQVTQARLIVGPLVLPGRTACLNCLERSRTEADRGWPAVVRAMRDDPPAPAVLALQAAADLAAGEVLDFVDGMHRPASTGATLERGCGEIEVHRRPWEPHPDCGCRLIARHP